MVETTHEAPGVRSDPDDRDHAPALGRRFVAPGVDVVRQPVNGYRTRSEGLDADDPSRQCGSPPTLHRHRPRDLTQRQELEQQGVCLRWTAAGMLEAESRFREV